MRRLLILSASVLALLAGPVHAAEEWGIDAKHCTAADSRISHPGGQLQMTYGSIAEKAAEQQIPTNIRLKEVKEFKIVGQRMHRLDIPKKVDGTAFAGQQF